MKVMSGMGSCGCDCVKDLDLTQRLSRSFRCGFCPYKSVVPHMQTRKVKFHAKRAIDFLAVGKYPTEEWRTLHLLQLTVAADPVLPLRSVLLGVGNISGTDTRTMQDVQVSQIEEVVMH